MQRALPHEPVVRKEHGLVDSERGELGAARGRVPVVARENLVVARERRGAAALAPAALANRVGLAGRLHVRDREHRIAPHHAHVAERVVDEADRVAAPRRVDVFLPQAAVLEQVLIGVDHQAHGGLPRRTSEESAHRDASRADPGALYPRELTERPTRT